MGQPRLEERRRSRRKNLTHEPITGDLGRDDGSFTAPFTALDISPVGLKIASFRMLEEGDHLFIRVEDGQAAGEVMWCNYDEEIEQYAAGIRLLEGSEDLINALSGAGALGPSLELESWLSELDLEYDGEW